MFTNDVLEKSLESSVSQVSPELPYDLILEERFDLAVCNSLGGFPLHLACAQNLPLSVVKKLAVAFPEAFVCSANAWSATPLFLACFHLAPNLEVIQYLVSQDYPSCLQGTPERPPLYHICMSIWRHPVEFSRKLTDWVLSKYPQAASLKDYSGRFPVHYAVLASDTERFHALLQSHDGDWVDGEGNHLLHLAVGSRHRVARSNILAICEKLPVALHTVNSRGELPAHISIKKVNRDLLLQRFPFAMLYTTKSGHTVLGNSRRELEEEIGLYYPLEDYEDLPDEISHGWERPCVSWIFPTDVSPLVLDELFCLLSTQVVPLLREILAQSCMATTHTGLPAEVIHEILLFAVPHYEEALCHTPYTS